MIDPGEIPMTSIAALIHDKSDFLRFLKTKFHLYHCSNVFFRDFQYGIMAYAAKNGIPVSYAKAEDLAKQMINLLTEAGILKPVQPGSWMLNYDSFRKPSAKAAATPNASAPVAPVKTAPATTI